jgi:hypothetical protein
MLGKHIKNIKRGVCKEAVGPNLHMATDLPKLMGPPNSQRRVPTLTSPSDREHFGGPGSSQTLTVTSHFISRD